VGTALKTISARITKSTSDLEELGEDYSDLADGMSKYREEIKAMSGVDIMINDNTYKDVYDIFKELSQVWDQLSQTQQARISEILGGTRGLTVISSIMQNFGDAEKALADATNAAGTAAKANEVVMDTTEKKIEQLKTSAQVLARDVLSSDLTKGIVDFGTKAIEVIDNLVNKFGALPVAIGALTGLDLIKNLGKIIKVLKSSEILSALTMTTGAATGITSLGDVAAATSLKFEAMAASIGVSTTALATFLGVIGGVALVVGAAAIAYDALTTTFDEAAKSADEARQNYEQTQSEIQSIQNELQSTGSRIDELNAKGGLTLVEQNELDKLYETESSLERQLAYKQQIAQVEAEAAANAARSALENEGFMAFGGGQTVKHGFWNDILYSVGQSMAMSTSGKMAAFDGGKTAELVKENQSESVNIIEATIRKQETLNDLQERQGEIVDHNSEEYKNNQDQISEFATQISDNWSLIDQYRQSIVDAGLAEASGFKEIIEQINHLEKLRAGYEERGDDGQWVLTELGKRAEALEKVQSFLSRPTLSGSFDALREALSNKHDLSLYAIMAQFPELTAAAQAAGVNIIDVINSIKAEMGLLDFDEVRNQLKGALDVSDFSSDSQKWLKDGWSNWIDSLSGEEIELLYSIKQSNDTSAWTMDDWMSALDAAKTTSAETSEAVSATLEEMQTGFEEASEAASKFYTALSESASDTGLSTDSIQAIKDMFSDLDGYNAFDLFEKTTTGVRLNTQALQELNDEYERHTKTEMQNELEALINEYNTATEALSNYTAGTEEYNNALANVNGLEAQIESALELQAQYEGLTSAYNKFVQAQSSGDNRDAYANIGDSYENVKELIDLGWVSDSEVTEYLDLMLAASARTSDVYADFDRLTQKIAGTDFSIMDFFQYDEDSEKLSSDGLYNFLDAVDTLDDSLVQVGDDGSYAFDWTASDLQRVSELTGMSVESIQLLEQAMKDAGMNVNIDTPLSALQSFKETAQESADQLTRLGLTDISFDIDSTDLDSINSQITEVQSILDGMRNSDGTINMELAGAEEAVQVLGALEAEKLSLEYPTLMSVDVNSSTAEGDLNMLLGLLQSFAAADATAKLGIDDGQAQADADALLAQIQSMEAVIPADLNLDTTSADSLLASLQSMDPSVFVTYFADTEDTDAEDAKSDGGNRTTTYTPETGLIDAVNAVTYGGTRTVTYTPNTSNLPTYFSSITRYVNYVARGDTGRGGAYGTARFSGTAHARGTAMAHGYWGTKNSGVALGGELGTELLVRDGHYYTIGENGAGFFNYKKGDIIFNAEQTEQIFKYGRIKYGKNRGNALATGTAFDSGSGGKRRRKTSSTTSLGSSSSSSSSSNSYKSSSSYNGNKTASSKASSSADDFAEDLDWIEVLLDRIERRIKSLARIAGSTFKSLTTRTSALGEEIATVADKIDYQQQAYDEYMHAAETISLDESYKALVREGKINLETITDKELNEKIKQYKDLYDKALDASDAVDELHESMAQLYQDNFDNVQEEYNNQLKLYEHLTNTYQNGIEQLEQKGYLISTEYYTALSNVEKQNISILNKQLDDMVDAMSEAMNSGEIEMYSSAWYSMQAEINGVKEAIDEANTSLLEYAKTMREVEWGYFDFVQDRISQLTQESNFLIDLLDRDELFDDGGKLTDAGMATLGLRGQNYNILMAQADQYRDEMLKVNKQLADDPYNTEILKRREELLKLQQESISAAEDERDAIIDLVHNGIDKQLDALKTLIDQYNDSLSSAKSLHDYQAKIEEQSKNIASLEKQLSAYSGDTSEEGRLNVQKLRSSLDDARSDLEETQYDRYISDQKQLLDDLYTDYELALNERFD